MLDELLVVQRISQKLKSRMDEYTSSSDRQLAEGVQKMHIAGQAKADAAVDEIISSTKRDADARLDQIGRESTSRINAALKSVIEYANGAVSRLLESIESRFEKDSAEFRRSAESQIAEAVSGVKKGDKGDKGSKGEKGADGVDGRDGVGIKRVDQPNPTSMRVVLTDGQETLITLPRGPRGGGGAVASAPAQALPTWSYYATTWSASPEFVASVAGGDVYAYTLSGVTRYRLVPEPYNAASDAFYSSFSAGVLSGLIVSRG